MKRNRIIAMLLGTALLVCGCQQAPEATDEEKKIEAQKGTTKTEEKSYQGKLDLISPAAYNNVDGLKLDKGDYISIIGKANGTQYWEEVKKGVAQAAEDINTALGYTGKDKVKVTYNAPDNADNVDDQVNLLDEELDRYPAAIGISIVDLQACQVQFDLATDSEIPVVTFDSGSDYQGVAADVSTDNEAAGKEAAEKLAEAMGDTGEIALFIQDSKSQAALAREKAVTDELTANHPNISVVNVYHMDELTTMQKTIADEINAGSYRPADSEFPDGVLTEENAVTADSITEDQVVDYILAKHPNITGCFAANGDAVKLAVDGLERNKMEKKVKVVGFDANADEIKDLQDGKVDGLIVQNPFGMGYATVIAAARASLDMGNEAVVNTGYTWVTKENLKTEEVQKILYAK
ncbi:MAG: substrate-binding domain-containing protein [Dorea sp.]